MGCNCKCKGSVSSRGSAGPQGAQGQTGASGLPGVGTTSLDFSYSKGDGSEYIIPHAALTYYQFATILFKGTNHYGASPASVSVICLRSGNVAMGKLRLYDVTNSVVIAENVSINTLTKQIIDLPITGTFPATAAIVELQAENASGSEHFQVYSLNIDF